jgi:hypothetical protein
MPASDSGIFFMKESLAAAKPFSGTLRLESRQIPKYVLPFNNLVVLEEHALAYPLGEFLLKVRHVSAAVLSI